MAAASQRPLRKTQSRSAPATERGTHVFEIAGYSIYKGLRAGDCVSSATFTVGGHHWCINFYPNGDGDEDYNSIYLVHVSKDNAKVMAIFDMRLLNHTTGLSEIVDPDRGAPSVFDDVNSMWGSPKFMKKSVLEGSPFLQNDRIVIECDVTVVMAVSKSEMICEIQVPPSDALDSLGKLLQSEKRCDVTFKVGSEVFHAHKFVLAMRSPVFEAEFYGPMGEKQKKNITVEDMQPAVFKALIHFIYTASIMPLMDDLGGDENQEMIRHLLVAADQYAMERLKVMCESILAKSLDVQNVATTLALADQHHCSQLKDVCIGFIAASNRIDDVMASQGYKQLKRACPDVTMEILEHSAKSRKM